MRTLGLCVTGHFGAAKVTNLCLHSMSFSFILQCCMLYVLLAITRRKIENTDDEIVRAINRCDGLNVTLKLIVRLICSSSLVRLALCCARSIL